MSPAPGQMLDQYRLVEKIGEGGMGVVWKARDTSLDRDVAIKLLPESFTADPVRLARFEREAKAVAALSHPNIVAIYGFGTADGLTYAAMELLRGRTLREHLDAGPLPLRKAVDVARQVAEGLAAAHDRGIVHRDLKPANVFLTPDGRARILDFGLAAAAEGGTGVAEDSDTRMDLTGPGVVVGTVGYMSPEQARGGAAGPAADVFALGVMLYEMLGGTPPFARDTAPETLTAILREDPPELTVAGTPAPPILARVVRRCLEKAPAERFHSARDLAFALESAVADSGTSQPSLPAAAEEARRASRRLSPALLGLLAVALVLAGVAIGWLLRPPAPAADPVRVSELTFSGSDYQPDVSPDGRLIAFTSSRDGVSQIWLRQVDGGVEQPLTEGPDVRPRFSPDGEAVVFLHRDGDAYSAYRVPVLGGQPRKLIENVVAVDWSPDGRRLAFLRGGTVGEQLSGTALGILDLESGSERVLTQFSGWDLYGVEWSPDGTRIATTKVGTQSASGNYRLLVINPQSDATEEIVPGNGAPLVSAPYWDGSRALIYARAATAVAGSPEANAVVRHDLDSGSERVLFWEPYLFPLRGSAVESTALRVLGPNRIVFDTFRQVQLVYELDLDTGVLRLLKQGVSSDRQPTYSPDGSHVLFTSNRSGNVDLYAYEFASGRVLQLTDDPASDWDGGYTPDGRSIMWGSDRTGNLEIWMADADGSSPRQVSHDGVDAENPTMTADGQWIVYNSGNPAHPGLFKVHPDGSGTTSLLPGNWTTPDVSPDGRYALFIDNDSATARTGVRVVDLQSGDADDFSVDIPYGAESPNITYGRGRWMPDGSAIVYLDVDEHGEALLMIQDFVPGQDTTATRRPLSDVRPEGLLESFGISPDGRRVALAAIQQIRTLKMADGVPLR